VHPLGIYIKKELAYDTIHLAQRYITADLSFLTK